MTPEGSHEASTRGGAEHLRGALRQGAGCPREACTRRGRPGTRSTADADPADADRAIPGTTDAGVVAPGAAGAGTADAGLVDAGLVGAGTA
ncbi:hypothetical protein [Streptomyces rubrogriseus]|uniref:hypothetical protein n=1 Tax=Streptomyces rubrogriseus TaxID=194673 RepID=UPI00142D732E|nr:hypothetical protein [Streptomyces rubrogriseus]